MSRKRTPEESILRKKKNVQTNREWYARQSIAKRLWMSAKARSKRNGREFSISVEDIVVPTHCLILGIKLIQGTRRQSLSSPTLDRKDNSLGYVKGNVGVISLRANILKSDLTPAQVESLVQYVS